MSLPSSPGSEDFAAFLDAELQSETNSDSEGHTTSQESDQEQTMYEMYSSPFLYCLNTFV